MSRAKVLLDRLQREALIRRQLRWWLVYGPIRSGTTYMMKGIAAASRLFVADWALRYPLQVPPDIPNIRFDRARARRDVARNVIRNAPRGGGSTLDLVVKDAQLRPETHEALVEAFGPPARKIFCVREPSGYMASAVKKFPTFAIQDFVREYLLDLETYTAIGGDVFVYHPDLTLDDYRRFLAPLELPGSAATEFVFRGEAADELVTPEMRAAYERFLRTMPPRALPG